MCSIHASAYFDIRFGASVLSKDTLGQNDTLIVSTSLINLSNQAYNNTITFGFSINGTQNVNQHIFSNPLQGQIVHIQPGDSIPLQFKIVLESQYFRAGPDIFVVWPIIPGNNTLPDTLNTSITIFDPGPDAINEPAEKVLKVYCSKQSVFIRNYNPQMGTANIKIYNTSGTAIYTGCIQDNIEIPLNDKSTAMYVVEIIAGDGKRNLFKVMKP